MKYPKSVNLLPILVLLAIVATLVQSFSIAQYPIEQGYCHNLVAKGPHGISRTVNLDVLTSRGESFFVTTKDLHTTYNFRVCSNLMCGGWPVWLSATCEQTFQNGEFPLGGSYPANPVASLSLDYKYGAIQFNTTQHCYGRTCRYSTITVVCDPAATYVLPPKDRTSPQFI
jgi:hypothetical protein